ncbi:MAG: glycerol-3-phosphate 1-O-acyltransferase PlsY [Bacteroidia bacterium]
MEVIVWVSLAYLLGSLTPGLWLARAYGVDIRKVGSGNIGSTNVYRVLGFWAGVLVQVVDIGKAVVPVWLAKLRAVPEAGLYAVATAAVLGHIYPIWAGFRGGKGINTLLGGMLIIEPLSALAATGTFLLTLSLSWIVSLSSLSGVASFLLWHGVVGEGSAIGYLAGVLWLGLVLYTHRQNLARLLAGKEPRVGQKSP